MSGNTLILGAGGFVGRHVLAGLGRPVIAGQRGGSAPAGLELRHVDATDPVALGAALDGVTAIVNCVAATPDAMVQATRALCEVAGPRRIVHLSSMAVYGAATGLVDEGRPLNPAGAYGESKAESEAILRRHVAAGGDAVLLRPACIHGPRSGQWTLRPARLLVQGRLGDLAAAGDGICNLTSVDDLVGAIAAALDKPDANGEAYNVSDPEPGTWNEYFLHLALALGATPLRRLPGWQVKAEKLAAYPLKAMEILGRKLRLPTPEPIPSSLWRVFSQDITLDHRRADAELGFTRKPPAEALAEAATWFLREGQG